MIGVAVEVSGKAMPCGHYIPEELSQELIKEAQQFFVISVMGPVLAAFCPAVGSASQFQNLKPKFSDFYWDS